MLLLSGKFKLLFPIFPQTLWMLVNKNLNFISVFINRYSPCLRRIIIVNNYYLVFILIFSVTYIYKCEKVDQYGYSVTVMYFSGLFHNWSGQYCQTLSGRRFDADFLEWFLQKYLRGTATKTSHRSMAFNSQGYVTWKL